GFGVDAGIKSDTVKVTIQTTLRVLSVTPVAGIYRSIPNGQVVVRFNHPLAGIVPNVPSGSGVSAFRFAVTLVPRGPDGTFGSPTALNQGSSPIHATLVYNPDAGNGTSTITLIPREPLSSDVYQVTASGNLKDVAGNTLLNNEGTPGAFSTQFTLRTTP